MALDAESPQWVNFIRWIVLFYLSVGLGLVELISTGAALLVDCFATGCTNATNFIDANKTA